MSCCRRFLSGSPPQTKPHGVAGVILVILPILSQSSTPIQTTGRMIEKYSFDEVVMVGWLLAIIPA